jgi:DNA-directed RNA polymerase subunit RPC12/RpoP
MAKFFICVNLFIFTLTIPAIAAEVYTVFCENCDYADKDFVIGFSENGEMISPGICPVCKELFEVFLRKGDSEGKKKYKCYLCSEKLYLYRDIEGEPLTEPGVEEKYQCPRCGLYGLVFGKETGEEEESLNVDGDSDTPDN